MFAWLALGPVAGADEPASSPVAQEDPFGESSAWDALERLPPRESWEFGVQITYGEITYWRGVQPPHPGFGFRGAWGRHKGDDRFGFGVNASLDGPIGLYLTTSLEPVASWDRVTRGVQLGASLGPALLLHTGSNRDPRFGLAPTAAVRMGWSQSWTRLGRRFFVVLEPKLRWVAEAPNPTVSLVIGQGRGR